MASNSSERLDEVVQSVIDTLNFQGVTILEMDILEDDIPYFKVAMSKKKRYRTEQDTLDFVYWTLWSLIYGKYSEDKSDLKIVLDYKEVE